MNPTARPLSAQPARSSEVPSSPVADELRRYGDHLRDVRGLSSGIALKNATFIFQNKIFSNSR
jgi:hypothetical protein